MNFSCCFFFLFWAAIHSLLGTTCQGILLLGNKDSLDLCRLEKILSGIEFCDVQIPGQQAALKKQLEDRFLNSPINEETIREIRKTIELFYKESHYPFVSVEFPIQEIVEGVIQVQIVESRAADIKVVGGNYTSPSLLKNYLGVPREPIDTSRVKKNLDFINRNPFRRVDLVYSPGEEPHTTDIQLLVEDRRPIRVYTGTDNSGVETTKRGRFYIGLDSAKTFYFDHFLSYRYTSSYDFHHFQAHTLQYIAFLPWRNLLNFYGGYASVYANLPFPEMRNHGQSYQASGRYTIPLNPSEHLNHEIEFGFDFKRTNNTIEFSETFPVVGPNVNLSQFVLRYGGDYGGKEWRIGFNGELFISPGEILGDESNSDYEELRPGAQNDWLYLKVLFKYLQRLPSSCSFSATVRAQISSQNLLPSEQIGLGGFDSVRGYDERQLNYDSGCILNTEFLSPAFNLFHRWWKKFPKDTFQLLGFIDLGGGGNYKPIPGEKKSDFLLGIGPGVRYLIDPWLTARLDLGIKLHQEDTFTGGNPMWYFNFTGSY